MKSHRQGRPRTVPQKPAAFTLIEMLVVLAIMLILAAMIFPALTIGRNRAYDTDCVNNLRQIGSALYQYATAIGGGYFPKPDTATEPDAFGGSLLSVRAALSEYVPTNSAMWYCRRYLKAKDLTTNAISTIGYFYWAWDNSGGTVYEVDTTAVSNRWTSKGLSANVPAAVLVSDRFQGPPVGTSPEEQYHAGLSAAVGLEQSGTMVLLSGISVIRVSPTRGVVR